MNIRVCSIVVGLDDNLRKFPWSIPCHLSGCKRAKSVSLLVGQSNLQSFYRMGGQTTLQGVALRPPQQLDCIITVS
jgi:hypothetical protein